MLTETKYRYNAMQANAAATYILFGLTVKSRKVRESGVKPDQRIRRILNYIDLGQANAPRKHACVWQWEILSARICFAGALRTTVKKRVQLLIAQRHKTVNVTERNEGGGWEEVTAQTCFDLFLKALAN